MTPGAPWTLSPDRCFGTDPARRAVARELYARVEDLPLVCPHGHVSPALLADPDARLCTPVESDHRRIWQRFAEHFHLFRGTPSGLWLSAELLR